jgi:hypothetical protein
VGKELTMADHAEAWWREQGKRVPRRDTARWQEMYETWAEWAFADMRGDQGQGKQRKGKKP